MTGVRHEVIVVAARRAQHKGPADSPASRPKGQLPSAIEPDYRCLASALLHCVRRRLVHLFRFKVYHLFDHGPVQDVELFDLPRKGAQLARFAKLEARAIANLGEADRSCKMAKPTDHRTFVGWRDRQGWSVSKSPATFLESLGLPSASPLRSLPSPLQRGPRSSRCSLHIAVKSFRRKGTERVCNVNHLQRCRPR